MRVQIDANYPADGVEVKEHNGVSVVRMLKDIERTPAATEEGQEAITANVVQMALPFGVEKADIVAHFDYYFDKALAAELAKAKELKEAQVQMLLTNSDYRSHKHADGEITDEQYAPWKALRQQWRDIINAIRAAETIELLNEIVWPEGL